MSSPKRKRILAKRNKPELTRLNGLPDWAVLSKQETAKVLGISDDTLDRLHRQGKGPTRIQTSMRRVGHTVGAIRVWQAAGAAEAAQIHQTRNPR
jgi:predicted DNA-binding transcriptional regulator AlpA